MNQFIYESKGKEKINELLRDFQRSKAFHGPIVPQQDLQPGLPKLFLSLMVVYAILSLLGY